MRSSSIRKTALPVLLFSVSALAGCAVPLKPPPQISYDDAEPAVLSADPPKPVEVVELPKLLPLPGQLKPLHEARSKPESGDPREAMATSMRCKSIRSHPGRSIRFMRRQGK
jgi:type IV secretion system protein TrbG